MYNLIYNLLILENNFYAKWAYLLFFGLILILELMVVSTKMAFGDTVDDAIEQLREDISYKKLASYRETWNSPVEYARALIE